MTHTCACHNRTFRTICGLKQHLLYTNKTTADQSDAIADILNTTPGEIVIETPKKYLQGNEWISDTEIPPEQAEDNETIDSEHDKDNKNFHDYVMHHLSSHTDFTRDMYVKLESHIASSKSNQDNASVIAELIGEIDRLRKEICDRDNRRILVQREKIASLGILREGEL